jgi:molybdopterin molybdotransferase
LLAALGLREVPVFKRLRVGLFSSGDELAEPGTRLSPGQIWDANRYLLRAVLTGFGCEVEDYGIVPDDAQTLEAHLSRAAKSCDLLVTSGGMSVGQEDHMRPTILRRGTLEIWQLAIKPGKPVGVGDIDHCPILALPGNPVAAAVTFIALGRAVVDRLSGAEATRLPAIRLPILSSISKSRGLMQFFAARLGRRADGATGIEILMHQGPAMLRPFAEADGFVILDDDTERIEAGDVVDFLPMSAVFR